MKKNLVICNGNTWWSYCHRRVYKSRRKTNSRKKGRATLQTFQTNFKPAFEMTNTTYEPQILQCSRKNSSCCGHVKNTAVTTGITSFSDIFNGGRKYEQVGTGSGVIISSDGYIVTNNHVIKDTTNIEITLNDRKKYEAELIGTDTKNDIALLKVDTDEELPLSLSQTQTT